MTDYLYGIDGQSGPEFSVSAALWLLDATVKSALLLAVTGIIAWLLRNRSAAIVHRVWTLGFCGCLVIPAATYFAPLGTLPIVPDRLANTDASSAHQLAFAPPNALGGPPTRDNSGALFPTSVQQRALQSESMAAVAASRRPAPSTAERATPAIAPASPVRSADLSHSPTATAQLSWFTVILYAWLAGIALCVLRSGWQRWTLARLLRLSQPVDSDEWKAVIADASSMLGFTRRVQLVQCPAAQTPAVAGLLRTIVILPRDTDLWSSDRRRLVLLHELGHAQRRDVLTHAVARLVTTIYWFNPLCWVGLIQMARLRELACDDLVLASGQPAADYADVLLDVARSYRNRSLGMAVGMVRRANVEDRILAILDRARNRMSLSPKAARRWLVMTLAVVALLGSLRLSTRAEPSGDSLPDAEEAKGAANENESEKAHADPDVRTMVVRITDDDGNPLEQASLHVSVWEIDASRRNFPNRDFLTDANGIVEVTLPHRLQILRMWPAKHGYVPEFKNFAQGTHDEGRLIPDRYEFQLTKGTKLSGTVVDEQGQPISGVKVEVKVDVSESASIEDPHPMLSTWLTDSDFNSDAPITNSDGHWAIYNAPPRPSGDDPFLFRLKHTHPNYVKDARWGELQEQQGVTTKTLRDGTAMIVLSRGVVVTGTVVDPAGQPVKEGLVIWHDNPYLADGVNETAINKDGRFETLPLSPGEYPITVVAPEFMPVQQTLRIAKGMDELRFELRPGKRLVMNIVDASGSPIPNAHVGIEKWGETEAVYNHKHPNVPESGIPRSADENGVYVWDWAPDDAVTYYVSAKNYILREITLIANDAGHVVELSQELIATGRVTDSETGRPVASFRVIPVTVFRPQFLSTSHREAVPGKDGKYQITLTDRATRNYRYKVRVDAPGYRSVLSEQSFGPTDGRVEVDFALEPAQGRAGRIVDADGNPVASASIVQGTPSDVPMIDDGALEWGTDLKTGAAGEFELLATFEPVRIRAIHASGFVEVLRQPDDEIGTLQLQPWAKISGQLVQDGGPMAEQAVFFNPIPDRGLGEARFQDSYQTRTDRDGRFEFSRVPPGLGSVRAYLGPWQDSPLTSSESVPVNLKPGEDKELILGGSGVTVTGTVNATGRGDVELNKNWSLNYLIRRDAPHQSSDEDGVLSFDPSGPVESSWFLDQNIYRWLATRPNHFVKLTPDGEFRIHGVSPGQYDLVLRLYEQPAGCLVETVGERVVPIEVTAVDVAAESMDVGAINVACRAGPRIGENMQVYEFVDATGRKRTIQELQGQYVVMHVWASWCAPCIAHMPEIQSSAADWREQPVTFVGLNIDEDRSLGRSLADRNGWNWAHMYLGDDSDMARQLAISTVPSYYLIGPDGLLAASSNEWSAIREHVDTAFGDSSE